MTDKRILSIGALAQATSVPVNTLRTWERRYGFPRSVRLPSGHRRFYSDQVVLVRWVIRALEAGFRPSALEDMDVDAIRNLVNVHRVDSSVRSHEVEIALQRWLDQVADIDSEGLTLSMKKAWGRVGAVEFLSSYVAHFLEDIGRGWANGRFSIAQEHAASACVAGFLSSRWREMSQGATGPRVVLATLPGERHSLGLHQAAVVVAMRGFQVHFLGADTPVSEITTAAIALKVRAVLISISVAAPKTRSRQQIKELRRLMPHQMELVIGGRGTPEGVPEHLDSMRALDGWAAAQSGSELSH